jgi:hypothetical protein
MSSDPIVRIRSGPRTAAGKRRSRGNALRHGFYARDILLPNENPNDFAKLVQELRDDHRAEGVLEDHLIWVIASAMWRKRRMLRAEAAEIARRADFEEYDRVRQQRLAAQDENGKLGLATDPANPLSLHCATELLTTLRLHFEARGYDGDWDITALRKIYGVRMDVGFPAAYIAIAPLTTDALKSPEPAAGESLKKEVMEAFDAEILRLQGLQEASEDIESKRADLATRAAQVPAPEVLDCFLRYEAHQDREIERAVTMLVNLQRERERRG